MKCLVFSLSVLLLTGTYLWTLHVYSPVILERDRLSSVWYLRELADEKLREFRDLKWVVSREERQQLLDDAVEILERIRRLRPDSEFYEYYWSIAKYQAVMFRGNPSSPEARSAFERILQLWEESGRESERLGNLLVYHYTHYVPDPDRAKEVLLRMIELDPQEGRRYDELVSLSIDQGETEEAIRYLEKKIELKLASAKDRQILAKLYFPLRRWDRVEELLRSSLAGGATSLENWLMYSLVLTIRGDLESAREAFRAFLEGSDDSPPFPPTPLQGVRGYPGVAFPRMPYLLLESSLIEEPGSR